jgi:CBS domain-containing protein
MNVGSLCQRKAITVRRSDDVTAAAELMRSHHIGYLVVVESDAGLERPVGVLTDRDIVVTVVARRTDPRTLRVGDIMSEQPVTVGEAEPLEYAAREMRRIGVRRLPVVGKRGELVGVLSMDELLETLVGELQNVTAALRSEQRIESSIRP